MPTQDTQPTAKRIIDAIREALGSAGWSKLTPDDRALVEACAADAAAVQLAALAAAAGGDPAAADRVRREKAHVDAQLLGLTAAAAADVSAAAWAAAARLLTTAATVLLAA